MHTYVHYKQTFARWWKTHYISTYLFFCFLFSFHFSAGWLKGDKKLKWKKDFYSLVFLSLFWSFYAKGVVVSKRFWCRRIRKERVVGSRITAFDFHKERFSIFVTFLIKKDRRRSKWTEHDQNQHSFGKKRNKNSQYQSKLMEISKKML